jgi:predicted amidohydrolase YtcJ
MNAARPTAEAVVIRGNRIVLVGSNDEALQASSGSARKLDLGGRTLLPGFVDTHAHVMDAGLGLLGPSLERCACIADVLEALKPRGQAPALIHAYGLDPTRLKEQRYPTRQELDSVAPHSIVFVVRSDLHSAALNTRALNSVSLRSRVVGVDRDDEGQTTGVVRAEAWELAIDELTGLIDRPTWEEALERATDQALRAGLTTVHALIDDYAGNGCHVDVARAFQAAHEDGDEATSVRLVPYVQTVEVDRVVDLGLPRIGGCLLVDGSLGSHTAALFQPYSDRPGWQGVLYFDDDELFDFIRRAHRANLQVAMHAIGDAAIERLLNAYERVLRRYPPREHRHRIEHFLLPTGDQIDRAAQLGLCVGMQPAFQYLWGGAEGMIWQRLGAQRYHRFAAHRSVLEAGIRVGGGSDSPVTPLSPLLGIHAAVNSPNVDERLTPADALELYTVNGAWLAFEEARKGSIVEGKLADMVALAEDPMKVEPVRIKDIAVDLTIVGGRVLYSRLGE